MLDHAIIFTSAFIALFVGHYLADFWLQTASQAEDKARPDWRGRFACLRHVATLTITKATILGITAAVIGLRISITAACIALIIDAASHYWADRRVTLKKLAELTGKYSFYRLGSPRPKQNDNPVLGTGAHALDQSWHITWLWIAALIIAAA